MDDQEFNLGIPIALSLLLHLLLLLIAAYFYNYQSPSPPLEKEEIVMVDLEKGYQIADIERPEVEKRPEKAKHIGVYDSSVPEETVATSSPRAPGRPVHRGGEGIENIKRPDPLNDGNERIAMLREQKLESRVPSTRLPEDFYPDYKYGPHTYINVMKHQDVGYFVQLKRIFKLAWDPTHALRSHYTAGEVSRGSIKVVLGIAIGPSGEMDELFVINSSGLKEYDQEAMRAVRASSPFHSPPNKLLANDKKLRVSWTFIVYM